VAVVTHKRVPPAGGGKEGGSEGGQGGIIRFMEITKNDEKIKTS